MKWTREAEDAVKKAPFFVRKKIRAKVEKEALEGGKKSVSLEDVRATQARYVSGMEKEIKGYRVEGCFGPGGCPNRVLKSEILLEQIEDLLKSENLLDFLKRNVNGKLKFHHEFKVVLADCPNACSQPQIKDIGIVGALAPEITENSCSGCESCVETCLEKAVELTGDEPAISIHKELCLYCGQCVRQCPTKTLIPGKTGYRVFLGGKLGRHPVLARELTGIFDRNKVLEIVGECVSFYKNKSKEGRRFAEILTDRDFQTFNEKFANWETEKNGRQQS